MTQQAPIKILNGPKQFTFFAGTAVWCDRRSVLGNPFKLLSEESRDEVCDAYQFYFDAIIAGNSPFAAADSLFENRPWLKKASGWKVPSRGEFMAELNRLEEIARTDDLGIACWCNPKRCHCNTIAANLTSVVLETIEQGLLFPL